MNRLTKIIVLGMLLLGSIRLLCAEDVVNFNLESVKEGHRTELSLNGAWEFLPVEWKDKDSFPAPEANWTEIKVPSYWERENESWKYYDIVWYKKEVNISGDLENKHIVVHFDRVNYECSVYLNKKLAGEHFGGFTDFEIDITPYIKPGTNEFLVKVMNWTAAVEPGSDFRVSEWLKGKCAYSSQVQAKVIGPVGPCQWGNIRQSGIGEDVILIVRGEVYIDDIFVKTSVNRKKLALEITVKNVDNQIHSVDLVGSVKGTEIKMEQKNIKLFPNSTELIKLDISWKNPILWSPDNPHLYYLETKLTEDKKCRDTKSTRFGFKEFIVDKTHFKLNGHKIRLFYDSWHHYYANHPRDLENGKQFLRHIKTLNVRCIRFHQQPAPPQWLDVCDEIGLLVVQESFIVGCGPRFTNPKYWENAKPQIKTWIKRDRNHPCIIMWSAENEYLAGFWRTVTKEDVRTIIQVEPWIKSADPTRPVIFCGDGTLMEEQLGKEGEPILTGIHYPDTYGWGMCVPNVYYWGEHSSNGRYYASRFQARKPICITEAHLGWSPGTVLIGKGPEEWPTHVISGVKHHWKKWNTLKAAHGAIGKMMLEAYRYCDFGLYGPNSMIGFKTLEPYEKEAFIPVCAVIKEYNKAFFGGSKIFRTVTIYNDALKRSDLRLDWCTKLWGRKYQSGSISTSLEPAEYKREKLILTMPKVKERTNLDFVLRLYDEDKLAFEDERLYFVFPKAFPENELQNIKVSLFEFGPEIAKILKGLKIKFNKVTEILIPKGANNWSYTPNYPNEAFPKDSRGRNWYEMNYDDSKWKKGTAPLGFGDKNIVVYGQEVSDNRGNFYFFRKKVVIKENPGNFKKIFLGVASDNGATVYINGKEVDKDPEFGEKSGHEFRYWNRLISLNTSLLSEGKNIIAACVYNGLDDGYRNDVYFDLALIGVYSWSETDLTIIGDYSLPAFQGAFSDKKIKDFLNNGGRILALQQETANIGDWFSAPLRLGPPVGCGGYGTRILAERSTNFAVWPNHPLLNGLKFSLQNDEPYGPSEKVLISDLCFWGKNNVVSRGGYILPEKEGFKAIVERANGEASLLEVKQGEGKCIFTQMELTGNFDEEPVARQIFVNILQYLAQKTSKN